jgi:hypothetical protein
MRSRAKLSDPRAIHELILWRILKFGSESQEIYNKYNMNYDEREIKKKI